MAESIIKNKLAQSSNTYESNYTYSSIRATRSGNVVTIDLNGLKNLTVQTNVLITTLDQKYAPSRNKTFTIQGTLSTREVFRIIIYSDGRLTAYAYQGVASQNNVVDSMTFVI